MGWRVPRSGDPSSCAVGYLHVDASLGKLALPFYEILPTMTRSRARITGAVYLLYFLTAILAASSIGRVPVAYSDAANLIANAGYVAVTLLLYRIFKPVSAGVALLAVLISIAGGVVQSLSLFHLAPPHSSLPIFGLFNLTIGYLILRSTFLPRVLGVRRCCRAWPGSRFYHRTF